MDTNSLYKEIVSERREKLKKYLLEFSHYDKDRLIRGAKNRGIFGDNQDNEQVYHALCQFSKHHDIKIHTPIPEINVSKQPENVFIEQIDDDGNTSLKKLNDDVDLKDASNFVEVLEKQRDILSNKLLKINGLIKLYKTIK